MSKLLSLCAITVCLAIAYIARHNLIVLAVTTSMAAGMLVEVLRVQLFFGRCLTLPLFLARTLYFNSNVRVSISYIMSIPVDGAQLLVRGNRITTQFQPVGGVYKFTFDESELFSRFRAHVDHRFERDAESSHDLRIVLKGRHVPKLMAWFDKGKDRELLPIREFYDELVVPGILKADDFIYVDCSYIGRRTFGLEFDKYSQGRQLIVADIYRLRPNSTQQLKLMDLKERIAGDSSGDIYFASPEDIMSGSKYLGSKSTFEIARTAQWLNDV
jgi:hypothetical protein